jgi:hypothetical protein
VVSGQLRRPLYPWEPAPGNHRIGGWVGPRAGLDDTGKISFLTGTRTPIPRLSSLFKILYTIHRPARYKFWTLFIALSFVQNTTSRRLDSVPVFRLCLLSWAQSTELVPVSWRANDNAQHFNNYINRHKPIDHMLSVTEVEIGWRYYQNNSCYYVFVHCMLHSIKMNVLVCFSMLSLHNINIIWRHNM